MARLYRRPDKPGGTYYADLFQDGRRIRRSLDTDKLKEAKLRLDAILKGKVGEKWGSDGLDIAPDAFWTAYQEWATLHKAKSSLERVGYDWRAFTEFLKPTTLGAVTTGDVERFKVHCVKRREWSAGTVNDALTRLKALYNRAKALGLYGKGNPFVGVANLKAPKNPPRFLDAQESEAMLQAAKDHDRDLYLFVALGLHLGLRPKESANARWEWFSFDRGTVLVPAVDGRFSTKDAEARAIPLSVKLREIVEPFRQPQGFVINPDKTEPGLWRIRYECKKSFATAVKSAQAALPDHDLAWLTPHGLRHTFASRLAIAGVSLYKIATWLGHSKLTTTAIYAHLAPADEDINRV